MGECDFDGEEEVIYCLGSDLVKKLGAVLHIMVLVGFGSYQSKH